MFDGLRARMFNWSASRASMKPDRILAVLGLEKGDNVLDLGSGGGYFALRFAKEAVPEGRVYAADINLGFLQFAGEKARAAALTNLQTVPIPDMEARIPARSLDMVFSRDVYHHLADRTAYFRKMARFLKPGARVAIIDWLPNASRLSGPPAGHRTAPERIIAEMEAAGFKVLESLDFLAGQSFTIFGLFVKR